MSKVSMLGKITCVEGKGADLEAAMAEMVAASGEVSGVEIYAYFSGDENEYWFFALMSNQEAMQSHNQSEAMQKAMSGLGELMAGPPDMHMVTPISANGFEI